LWTGIALQNQEALLHGLDRLGRSLDELRGALERRDADGLTALFQHARTCPVLESGEPALPEPT
jgi:prephenate dehydrogenase